MAELRRFAALAILALLGFGAPLAFGLVDYPWKAAACALFATGLLIFPPRFPAPTRGGRAFWLLVIVLLVGKEVLPASWFGAAAWRTTLTQNWSLTLPSIHHPELGQAVEGWGALLLAVLWFGWVRTLAASGTFARRVAWALFLSGAVLAVVCFVMPRQQELGIYNVRLTPGWTGFGPFPNRNHTADFLAMSAVLGLGLLLREFRHGAKWRAGLIAALVLTIALAVLASGSRGGLIAGATGLVLFGIMQMRERGGRKSVVAALAALLLAASALLMGGGQVLERFQSAKEAGISNTMRREIWANTFEMVREAPLFGFGFGSFPHIFPQYDHLQLEGEMVVHPESSWLLWLVENGALLTLLLAGGLGAMIFRNVRELKKNEQGFDIRVAAFSTVAVIVLHSIWDVPAHRWATAGFGIAALALACPLRDRNAPLRPGAALIPGVAFVLFFTGIMLQQPRWMPAALESLLARERLRRSAAGLDDLAAAGRFFPLSPELHYLSGARLLHTPGRHDEALKELQLATQLKKPAWTMPAAAATLCGADSPAMARYFWTLAMDRSGHRREEMFILAFEQALSLQNAQSIAAWQGYADAHPELLPTVAQRVPEPEGRIIFERWWQQRAARADLEIYEQANCMGLLARFGDEPRLAAWRKTHPELEATQFRAWARLLHGWGKDDAAWPLLTAHLPDLPWPELKTLTSTDLLEAHWMRAPEDMMNAQLLAVTWRKAGQTADSERVVLVAAMQPKAPRWFLRKAAYLAAAAGKKGDGVAFLLRDQ